MHWSSIFIIIIMNFCQETKLVMFQNIWFRVGSLLLLTIHILTIILNLIITLHFPTVEPIQDQTGSGPNKSKAWNISMQSKQHTGLFLVGIKQCGQLPWKRFPRCLLLIINCYLYSTYNIPDWVEGVKSYKCL